MTCFIILMINKGDILEVNPPKNKQTQKHTHPFKYQLWSNSLSVASQAKHAPESPGKLVKVSPGPTTLVSDSVKSRVEPKNVHF